MNSAAALETFINKYYTVLGILAQNNVAVNITIFSIASRKYRVSAPYKDVAEIKFNIPECFIVSSFCLSFCQTSSLL